MRVELAHAALRVTDGSRDAPLNAVQSDCVATWTFSCAPTKKFVRGQNWPEFGVSVAVHPYLAQANEARNASAFDGHRTHEEQGRSQRPARTHHSSKQKSD